MKTTGLAFSTVAILVMMLFSKGVVYADVIATKTVIPTRVGTKESSNDLSKQDTEYFAKRQNSVQIAGSSEGFKLLGGTILVVAFIIVMGSIAISK